MKNSDNTKLEHFVLPNGVKVSFEPEEHKYFVNGEEVPSITTLIQNHYGNKYAFVRPEILKASADYGTKVHAEIEEYINARKKDPNAELVTIHDEVKNYFKFVEPIYDIKPIMTEKVVVLYAPDGTVAAAGRFDMLGTVKGKTTLIDFKTTSSINKQSVTAQLNLYLIGLLHSGYVKDIKDIDVGVVHLSGLKSTYAPIPKLQEDFYLTFVI